MGRVNKILIVEDNEINQELITIILQKAGYQTENAFSGQEALEKVEKEHFEIIFMDIQMPGMDGVETTRLIRESGNGKKSIIIAMTAFAIDGSERDFLDSGMDYYIPKPIKSKEVIEIIEKIKGMVQNEEKCDKNIEDNQLPINIAVLLDAMANNDILLKKTVEIIMKSYPDKLTRIEKGIKENNFDEIERAGHSFKGSIGILSEKIHKISHDIEKMGKNKEITDIDLLFEKLKNEMEKIRIFFEDYYSKK